MPSKNKARKENIYNFPNFITFLRVILTFLTIYLIVSKAEIWYIIASFIAGMLTDFFDGQIARRFNLATEFGKRFDIIADRFLMIATVIGLVFYYDQLNQLDNWHLVQIFLIMSREMLSLPFAAVLIISKKDVPDAKFIGKLTTCMQGFAFPAILLSIYFDVFTYISPVLAIATCIIGIFSAATFIKDMNK